ncbi:MAG: hypothetical protein JF886_13230 [Candidatus Dormibacteraeota bacterium]|uniref:Uncharacterized protein n=1 Tax=Candidatus Aeolococcus gillhamiae TaxID=3127015 RepID=A0A934JXC2_9BACT|nr:hypothetical protein [Candidatus Dormibacteraeota bacterium]
MQAVAGELVRRDIVPEDAPSCTLRQQTADECVDLVPRAALAADHVLYGVVLAKGLERQHT